MSSSMDLLFNIEGMTTFGVTIVGVAIKGILYLRMPFFWIHPR
jgi:hypothetical protein